MIDYNDYNILDGDWIENLGEKKERRTRTHIMVTSLIARDWNCTICGAIIPRESKILSIEYIEMYNPEDTAFHREFEICQSCIEKIAGSLKYF